MDREKFFELSYPSAGRQDLKVSLFTLISALVSAGIIFILVAVTALHFGFSIRIMLITH